MAELINWKVARKFEVPETGVGGLNAEKRKEINRIENEDLEWRGKWKDYFPP